ncbi:MAG: chorismate synthase [Candidatus Omnitrophota bacterium]
MLRYLTAGESHGKALLAILEGMPSGLKVDAGAINKELARRQQGFGRGKRMEIERDRAEILSGTRRSVTIGSPIAILIKNNDSSIDRLPPITCPRPGHADLAGGMKYDFNDLRNSLERSSARETAARTAVGALCRLLLGEFDIEINSRVTMVGGISTGSEYGGEPRELVKQEIESAKKEGNTLGGIFEVKATGVPTGLGSFASSDRRLDGRLAGALMSIQAIKGVEVGLGFKSAERLGSMVHDEITYSPKKGFLRNTNNAGGIEGGISNGQPIILKCAMKPISTLIEPLMSVDIRTKKPKRATVERSDVCAVWAAGVVAEAVVAFELAKAMLEKFGADSVKEITRNYDGYMKQLRQF